MSRDIKMTMPVVINKCYGGYGLSDKASHMLAEKKGLKIRKEYSWVIENTHNSLNSVIPRNDPDLIEIVLKLGKAASDECSELVVVNVEVTIEIENYDGMEKVHVYGFENGY